MKGVASRPDPLQIRPGKVAQTKVEVASRNRLLHGVRVTVELVANRRSDEVGAIGIESLSDQQIDMAEIDKSQIDRDLLTIREAVCPSFKTILPPSGWKVFGRHLRKYKTLGVFRKRQASRLAGWLTNASSRSSSPRRSRLPTRADREAETCGVGTQGSRVVNAITARRRPHACRGALSGTIDRRSRRRFLRQHRGDGSKERINRSYLSRTIPFRSSHLQSPSFDGAAGRHRPHRKEVQDAAWCEPEQVARRRLSVPRCQSIVGGRRATVARPN